MGCPQAARRASKIAIAAAHHEGCGVGVSAFAIILEVSSPYEALA
jgi:hypothetical protein